MDAVWDEEKRHWRAVPVAVERVPTPRYEVTFWFDTWTGDTTPITREPGMPSRRFRTGTYGSVEIKGPDAFGIFDAGFRAFGWGISVWNRVDPWDYEEGVEIAGERAIEDALWGNSKDELRVKEAAFLALRSLTRAELMDGGSITRVVWLGR